MAAPIDASLAIGVARAKEQEEQSTIRPWTGYREVVPDNKADRSDYYYPRGRETVGHLLRVGRMSFGFFDHSSDYPSSGGVASYAVGVDPEAARPDDCCGTNPGLHSYFYRERLTGYCGQVQRSLPTQNGTVQGDFLARPYQHHIANLGLTNRYFFFLTISSFDTGRPGSHSCYILYRLAGTKLGGITLGILSHPHKENYDNGVGS